MIGVLNKPGKSRNMIAAPKGYESKEKDLGGCGYHNHTVRVLES